MLEETGLDYTEHYVSIDKGEQFAAEFLKISPNNKIPAIVDHDGPNGETVSVFESGCILLYLAEKTGASCRCPLWHGSKRWNGYSGRWVVSVPMLGQAHHFRAYAPERIQYAYDRYSNEAQRLYQVLDRRLDGRDFVAAGDYTIADMAIFPWCRLHGRQGQNLAAHPNVKRWFDAIAARPAVTRDMAKLEDKADQKKWSDDDWSNLFGADQYRQR